MITPMTLSNRFMKAYQFDTLEEDIVLGAGGSKTYHLAEIGRNGRGADIAKQVLDDQISLSKGMQGIVVIPRAGVRAHVHMLSKYNPLPRTEAGAVVIHSAGAFVNGDVLETMTMISPSAMATLHRDMDGIAMVLVLSGKSS